MCIFFSVHNSSTDLETKYSIAPSEVEWYNCIVKMNHTMESLQIWQILTNTSGLYGKTISGFFLNTFANDYCCSLCVYSLWLWSKPLQFVCVSCISVLVLIFIVLTQRSKTEHLLIDPDDALRDNYVTYEEEGAGNNRIMWPCRMWVIIGTECCFVGYVCHKWLIYKCGELYVSMYVFINIK